MKHAFIIFDLDFCLFDTNSMRVGLGKRFKSFFERYPYYFSQSKSADLINQAWQTAPHELVENWPSHIGAAFFKFYRELPVPPEAVLYPDTIAGLDALRSAEVTLFLVTKGLEGFQQRKVDHLRIRSFFEQVIVVGPDSVLSTKLEAMTGILLSHRLDPHTGMVVGDSGDELGAGRLLGLTTVQTVRPKVRQLEANHHIAELAALLPLVTVSR